MTDPTPLAAPTAPVTTPPAPPGPPAVEQSAPPAPTVPTAPVAPVAEAPAPAETPPPAVVDVPPVTTPPVVADVPPPPAAPAAPKVAVGGLIAHTFIDTYVGEDAEVTRYGLVIAENGQDALVVWLPEGIAQLPVEQLLAIA